MSIPAPTVGLPDNHAIKPDNGPAYLLSSSGEFQRSLSRRCPGTCDWVLNTSEYKAWHDERSERPALRIHGPPGTGKSVLAASIVNHLQKTEQDVPIFHFFGPQEHRMPLPTSTQSQSLELSLVLNWLAQGLNWSSDLEDKLEPLARMSPEHNPLETGRLRWNRRWNFLHYVRLSKLWGIFIESFKDTPKIYCAIDDVDAFQDPESATFLRMLLDWKECHPGRIKMLLTSSSTAVLADDVFLSTQDDNVSQDIRIVVDKHLDLFRLPDGDKTKALIKNKLTGKSFLYARMAMLCLEHDSDTVAVTELLTDPNVDLYALYEHVLKSCPSALGSFSIHEYRKAVLALLLYSGFRLRRLEITLALEVLYGPEAKDQKLVQSAFGPLLEFMQDDTFALINKSFIRFAHDRDRSSKSQEILPIISSFEAHQLLGTIAMRCMLGDYFDGKRVEDHLKDATRLWQSTTICMPLFGWAASTWFLHARELPEITGEFKDLLLEWLNSRKENLVLWIKKVCRPPNLGLDRDDCIPSVTLLHIAAWSGSISMMKLAREQGFSYTEVMNDGTSALAIAASHGHCNLIKFLLDHEVDICVLDQDGKSPLDHAVSYNHVEAVRLLLKAGAPVNTEVNASQLDDYQTKGIRRRSAFSHACEIEVAKELILLANDGKEIANALDKAASDGSTDWVDLILTSPLANINGIGGDTPLFRAGLYHNVEVIQMLLSRGADPNKRCMGLRSHGCIMVSYRPGDALSSPLHAVAGFDTVGICAWYGADQRRLERSRQCAKALIDAGANVNAKGLHGKTPLHLSVSRDLSSVVEVLLQNGADLSILNDAGETCLAKVKLSEKTIPMIELLIKKGLKLDQAHEVSGNVPFHSILRSDSPGSSPNLSLLSPFINDWNVPDKDGNTILHRVLADHFVWKEGSIAMLISLGADPRRRNKSGQEPLHILAQNYSQFGDSAEAIVNLLLSAGADMEAQDDQNRTPLHYLASHLSTDFRRMIRFIREFGADPRVIDENGNGIMHLFLQNRPSEAAVMALLDVGVDILGVNCDGENSMHVLMRSESVIQEVVPYQIIQQLSGKGVSIMKQDKRGNTPLHVLCQQNLEFGWRLEKLRPSIYASIIELGNDRMTDIKNNEGLQPLQLAAATNSILVEVLISKGASTMVRTKQKQNLLHIAITAHKSNIVGILIDHYKETETLDITLNHRDVKGYTPLHAACEAINKEAISLLLEAGATFTIRDDAGCTPLELANKRFEEIKLPRDIPQCFWDDRGGQLMEIICLLAQCQGEPLSLRRDYGNLPDRKSAQIQSVWYSRAIAKGAFGAFEECIESGADFGPVETSQNQDLLHMLVKGGYSVLFGLIAQSIRNSTWPKGSNVVPPYLLTAVSQYEPNMPIIRLLVERFGADVNSLEQSDKAPQFNSYGSPLHVLSSGHIWWRKKAMKYLLEKGADPNVKNKSGDTPLQVIISNAKNGYSIDKEIVKMLLDYGANPNQTDEKGFAPLDHMLEDPELINMLVQAGGQPSCPDLTAELLMAISKRDSAKARAILETGQDCNRLPPETPISKKGGFNPTLPCGNGYPLEVAAIQDYPNFEPDISLVKLLLEYGANPYQPKCTRFDSNEQTTILHSVIQKSHCPELCDLFLHLEGTDIESRDPRGDTFFLAACRYRSNSMDIWLKPESEQSQKMRCMEFYERGADIRAVNKAGENVLHLLLATDNGGCTDELSRKTLSFFARECPDFVNSRNSQGFTPLQLAAGNGFEWAWEILCDAGADLHMVSPDGKTALHDSFSISGDWFKWAKRLIDMGIDINARDGRGETPVFDWARRARAIKDENDGEVLSDSLEEREMKRFQKTLGFFKEAGSDFHILNNRGENLLHVLAFRNFSFSFSGGYDSNLIIFKILVAYGLDPLAQNEKGWSALDCALSKGNQNLIEWYTTDGKRT